MGKKSKLNKLRNRKINEKKQLKDWRKSKKCQECGTTKNLTSHHLKQKKNGGKDIRSNLVVLCFKCHSKEHNISHSNLQYE